VIANLELVASDDFACVTDDTLVNYIMNTPVSEQTVRIEHYPHDAGPVHIHAIRFAAPVTGMATKTNRGTYDADSNFTRALKVASCI